MNREEAQKFTAKNNLEYRPLSLGTMAILETQDNAVLFNLLSKQAGIMANAKDLLIFLYVHHKDKSLSELQTELDKGILNANALQWYEEQNALTIAQGVDYFTGTQEALRLSQYELIDKGEKSKNQQAPR